MSDTVLSTPNKPVGRRTIAKGMAWSVPAIAVAAPAPAAAASLQIVPGINGWNQHYYTGDRSCNHQIRVDSLPSEGGSTPDGAPWGLYIYDVISGTTTITNARITYWIRGNTNVSWATQDGHSSCWGSPVQGTSQTKDDGQTYTPYTWTYGCPINSGSVSPDGRLYLQRFHMRARFSLADRICNEVCFWAQRHVTVDGAVQTFERKRGFRDCAGQTVNSLAPQTELQRSEDGAEEVASVSETAAG